MMQIPFLDKCVLVFDAANGEAHLVEVRSRGGRLSIIRMLKQPVQGKLTETRTRAAVCLDAQHVRHVVLHGPAFDDPESLELWVQSEIERQLPDHVDSDDFVVRRRVLEQTEKHTRILMALARHEAIEAKKAQLEDRELHPLSIDSKEASMARILAYHPLFGVGSVAVVLVHHTSASLIYYEDGILQTIVSLAQDSAASSALVEEVHSTLIAWMAEGIMYSLPAVMIVGEGSEAIIREMQQNVALREHVTDATIQIPTRPDHLKISPEQAPLAAIAIQQIYPELNDFNFLDEAQAEEGCELIEKQEALLSMLIGGGILVSLLLITIVAAGFIATRLSASEARLLEMADQITQIEAARAEVEQLSQDVAQAKKLATERTRTAIILETAARQVPAGLWLEAIDVERGAEEAILKLSGLALDQQELAQYLDRLEEASLMEGVRLAYSENISAEQHYRHASTVRPIQRRPLVQFAIETDVKNPGEAR